MRIAPACTNHLDLTFFLLILNKIDYFSQFQPQASPATLQNNTQVKHHPDVTLNALNTEVDVEGSLDFDSTAPDV